MRRFSILATLVASAAALLVLGAAPVATGAPTANITFTETSDGHTCTVVVRSDKDISNFTINGVKTELGSGTTVLEFTGLSEGNVITVKAGTTVASYTVQGPCAAPHDHDGDGHADDHR